MDISKVIKDAIDRLPAGEHKQGLASIINHIDVAIEHLISGETANKPHLFTDAVYRCNQAYEGSIKEAYKALTGQDYSKKSTSTLEKYLEDKNVLRPKVLDQLRRYRQEWRNPSTHDHTMDFDENEAYLAILTISAFAKVCVGQIGQKLLYEQAQKAGGMTSKKASSQSDLADLVSIFSEEYFSKEIRERFPEGSARESEISASLAGMLSFIPDSIVEIEHRLLDDSKLRSDLYISKEDENCIVELRSLKSVRNIADAIYRLSRYRDADKSAHAVMVLYDLDHNEYDSIEFTREGDRGRTMVLVPTVAKAKFERMAQRRADAHTVSL